jgi:hypothetical protein
MRRTFPHLPAVLIAAAALTLAVSGADAAWKTVTVDLESAEGAPEVLRGTAIAYGWYIRDFTPKGVKDRLQTDKKAFLFQDRAFPLRDLVSIEFEHELERTTGLRTPSKVHLSYIRPGTKELLTIDRPVSELQGFGGPKPIVFVVTTADGTKEIDLTPPLTEEARKRYRPILRILFE